MKTTNQMNRKNFFGMLGKGAFLAVAASAIPFNFFNKIAKASEQKKIKVEIHPSAVKRNNKV